MLSTYFISTIFSASILSDQREKPSGALLQLNAIKCASTSPSIFFSLVLLIAFRSRQASNPSSTNLCLTRSIIRILIFNTRLISLPVIFSPYSPSSQLSSMYAVRNCCELWEPLLMMFMSSSCSSDVNDTLYFIMFFGCQNNNPIRQYQVDWTLGAYPAKRDESRPLRKNL